MFEHRLVDVVWVAKSLVDDDQNSVLDSTDVPSFEKLGISEQNLPDILGCYRDKLTSMQQPLS